MSKETEHTTDRGTPKQLESMGDNRSYFLANLNSSSSSLPLRRQSYSKLF